MTQFQSFFISASGDANQCDELNSFLKSHIIVRTVENLIATAQNCGIQILVEYKNINENALSKQTKKIDWRASLKNDTERWFFDKLKEFRVNIAKQKKIVAYMVCKDEHLVSIIQKPSITVQEIEKLPNAGNIMLKDFAADLHKEFNRLLQQNAAQTAQNPQNAPNEQNAGELPSSPDTAQNPREQSIFEAGTIPF